MIAAIHPPSESFPPPQQHAPKPQRLPAMHLQDPVHVLCTLLGIAPNDLSVPCRILKVDPKERNLARIEEAARACFARVQSVQHHIALEHGQWMMQVVAHARSTMLRAAMAPPVSPPIQSAPLPTAMSSAAYESPAPSPTTSEPLLAIRTRAPRYRRGITIENLTGAVGSLVMCGTVLLGVGWFVNQSWKDLKDRTKQAPAPELAVVEEKPVPRTVGTGRGKPATLGRNPAVPAGNQVASQQVGRGGEANARKQLEDALTLARQGSFDEALRLSQRAAKALPDQGEGLELIVEYSRQYPGLADQAVKALNGSSEVDLGRPFGKAQFVDQNANEITFFAKGQHETFSIEKFNSLKGVRFRVTRDFLDNAENPANDLILGACHFLMKVNDKGENADESDGVREAERRIGKAIASCDPTSAEQGTAMMKAMKSLAEK